MVNYYSNENIDKIKKHILTKENIKTDAIPLEVFRNAVMVCLGMGETTAQRWIRNYVSVNLIDVIHDKEKKEWIVHWK